MCIRDRCSNNGANEESSSPAQQSSNQSSTPVEGSNSQNDSSEPTESIEQNVSSTPTETAAKSLVVYFSWSGNTENVAKSIQSQTDSDIFEIVPSTPYSGDYDTVVDLSLIHISEPTRQAEISYAVFCLKKKKKHELVRIEHSSKNK